MADDAKTTDAPAAADDDKHPVVKAAENTGKALKKFGSDIHTKLHAREVLTIAVTVPADGDETTIKVPDGREFTVKIPDGSSPGSTFDYEYESKSVMDHADHVGGKIVDGTDVAVEKTHQLMRRASGMLQDKLHAKDKLRVTVTVPGDYKAGDEITIKVADGREFCFVAPAGKDAPGDEFDVEYDSMSFHDHMHKFTTDIHTHLKDHYDTVVGETHKHASNLHDHTHDRETKKMTVTVPGDSKAGEEFDVKVEDGRTLKATVPDGKGPGDEFEFEYEQLSMADHIKKHADLMDEHVNTSVNAIHDAIAMTHETMHAKDIKSMTTIVPPENKEGDEIMVVVEDGRTVKVTVPDGKGPGDEFEFEYDGMSFHDHAQKHLDKVQGHINTAANKISELFNKAVGDMEMHVTHRAQMSIDVLVPLGKKPGDKLDVKVQDGRTLTATVPADGVPGHKFKFEYEGKSLHDHVFDLHEHAHKRVHMHYDEAMKVMVKDKDDGDDGAAPADDDEKKSDDAPKPVTAVDAKATTEPPSKFDIDML